MKKFLKSFGILIGCLVIISITIYKVNACIHACEPDVVFVELDSKTLYVEEYGKGNRRTIVYFHGGPGATCLDFANQAKALGKKYHVVSFDQYGVMRSDSISENESFGMIDHVKLIDKMRVKLGIQSWTVLGHSYGGMLALLYAYTFPEKTEAVIYECPCWDWVLSTKSVASFLIPYYEKIESKEDLSNCCKIIEKNYNDRSEAFNDFRTVLNRVKDEKVRNYLHGITIEEYEKNRQQINLPQDGWQKSNIHFQKLVDAGEIFNEYLPYLKEIKQPSLLLVGKYDPVCGEDQRDYFRQFAIRGTVEEFQNSGHFPRIEESHKYTESVINFLEHCF